MIRNYFKVAWRNLSRNKVHTFINVAGLSVGLACSLLILLWVQDERSVDGFHVNGKRLYQVYERQRVDGKTDATYNTQGLLADELKKQIPQVQYASGLEQNRPYTFEANNKAIKMDGSFAGPDFFRMFSYPLLQGTPATALDKSESVAISRRMAEAFFGSAEGAIGKAIRFENRTNLLVTAVFENVPANSSQQFDFLRSWKAFVTENQWAGNWGSTSPYTLIQLRADADPEKVGRQIKDFISLYRPEAKGSRTELVLQPYTEKYLHSTFKNGQINGGRIEYVRLFSVGAIFILLIACINFMNLSTARSATRAKEVGIRKVIGAARSYLAGQFLSEAVVITFLSVLIAVMLVVGLLPAYNTLTGKQLAMPVEQPGFWLTLSALFVFTGLVAGSYPAFFLSSLNPIRVLSGRFTFGRSTTFLRKGLVVFQFALSIILIVGMVVIYRQVQYVQNTNLGYERENLLYLPLDGELVKKYDVFKDEASKIPGVVSVSKMKESPTVIGHTNGDIGWTGKDPNLNTSFSDAAVGYDFVKTMKLQLKEGRDFSREFADSASYLLNEAAVKKISYQDPVGKPLWWGNRQGKIIGVLKDFHFNSMHTTIEPLVIRLADNQKWGTILIRIEAGKTKEVIAGLEKICKAMNPDFTYAYQFSDQEYSKLYKSEQVVSQLSNYFAFLAIFISCLGLFGLAMFTASQRTKEIGIRKVLGASVTNIVIQLSANFLAPVTIAMLVAFPVAWYLVNSWLQNFAYKIAVGWWIFALTGFITLVIALLTVSYQSIKAALANPVKSLRSE